MIIFKLCWWYIKILLIGTLIVCLSPVLLIIFALSPTATKMVLLMLLGMLDLGREKQKS